MGVVMNSIDYTIKPRSNWISTSLQGYIKASYADIVKVFGHPSSTETSGDQKVDLEWQLQIDDKDFNTIRPFTIYNWKDYDGGYAAMASPDYIWHIGGTSGIVTAFVQEYFNKETV